MGAERRCRRILLGEEEIRTRAAVSGSARSDAARTIEGVEDALDAVAGGAQRHRELVLCGKQGRRAQERKRWRPPGRDHQFPAATGCEARAVQRMLQGRKQPPAELLVRRACLMVRPARGPLLGRVEPRRPQAVVGGLGVRPFEPEPARGARGERSHHTREEDQ